jgi:heterodisulfide reductase subunit B
MRYAFFVGCVMPVKYPGHESATRAVAEALDLELVDLPFSCCSAPTLLRLVHYDSWLALAARNIALAEQEGMSVLTVCNGCTNTLKEAKQVLQNDPAQKKMVNEILKPWGREFTGEAEVKHLLDVLLEDVGLEAIRARTETELPFRIGCHYGCHFFRPPRIMYPDRLSPSKHFLPTQMDEILGAAGVSPVQYNRRLLCCGSGLGTKMDLEAANQITREKLSHMADKQVQAICVGCPSCFEQFDRAQVLLNRKEDCNYNMPVLYISQLLGLAFGVPKERLGFDQHRTKVTPLLEGG